MTLNILHEIGAGPDAPNAAFPAMAGSATAEPGAFRTGLQALLASLDEGQPEASAVESCSIANEGVPQSAPVGSSDVQAKVRDHSGAAHSAVLTAKAKSQAPVHAQTRIKPPSQAPGTEGKETSDATERVAYKPIRAAGGGRERAGIAQSSVTVARRLAASQSDGIRQDAIPVVQQEIPSAAGVPIARLMPGAMETAPASNWSEGRRSNWSAAPPLSYDVAESAQVSAARMPMAGHAEPSPEATQDDSSRYARRANRAAAPAQPIAAENPEALTASDSFASVAAIRTSQQISRESGATAQSGVARSSFVSPLDEPAEARTSGQSGEVDQGRRVSSQGITGAEVEGMVCPETSQPLSSERSAPSTSAPRPAEQDADRFVTSGAEDRAEMRQTAPSRSANPEDGRTDIGFDETGYGSSTPATASLDANPDTANSSSPQHSTSARHAAGNSPSTESFSEAQRSDSNPVVGHKAYSPTAKEIIPNDSIPSVGETVTEQDPLANANNRLSTSASQVELLNNPPTVISTLQEAVEDHSGTVARDQSRRPASSENIATPIGQSAVAKTVASFFPSFDLVTTQASSNVQDLRRANSGERSARANFETTDGLPPSPWSGDLSEERAGAPAAGPSRAPSQAAPSSGTTVPSASPLHPHKIDASLPAQSPSFHSDSPNASPVRAGQASSASMDDLQKPSASVFPVPRIAESAGGVSAARETGTAHSPAHIQAPFAPLATVSDAVSLASAPAIAAMRDRLILPGHGSAAASPDTFAAIDAAGTTAPTPSTTWIHAGPRQAEAGYLDPSLGWVGVRAESSGSTLHASILPGTTEAAQTLSAHLASLNAYVAVHHGESSHVSIVAPNQGEVPTGAQHQSGDGRGTQHERPREPATQHTSAKDPVAGSGASAQVHQTQLEPVLVALSTGAHISVMA